MLALESRFSVIERLDRQVLAGSLFSGTGEQASGRVDVPGKDNQQHAAAAIETICFFVKSLGGASYVVKMEHHATVARVKQHVALKSGVVRMLSTWSGKAGCFGMVTRWDILGSYGTRNSTCVPISVAVWVWTGSPRFLGNGCASLVAWVGAGRRGKVVTGAVRLGWAGVVARGPEGVSLSWTAKQPGVAYINPAKRVLRGFHGGTGQSLPKLVPTGPVSSSHQGLADPAILLPLLQSLGLPEEVLEAVRARIATQKLPRRFLGKNSFRCSEPRLTCMLSRSPRKVERKRGCSLDETVGACTAPGGIP